jgi:Recombinase zinc beta ribbon domain/Recombinase
MRRIFKQCLAGAPPRQIARDLNRDGLRGPRGALWSPSTIHWQPEGRRFNQFRQPNYLFSGLTKCGECGAGFVVYAHDHLGCFGTRDRGTCTNKLTIARHEVEARVLRALQNKLMRKDFFEELCREFAKEMNRLRMERRAGLKMRSVSLSGSNARFRQ